jgi:DNA polymerase-3 subunit epsilon
VRHICLNIKATTRNPSGAHPFEIAVVEFHPDTGAVLDEASWLVNPGRSIPTEVRALTGVTNEQRKSWPRWRSDILREILDRVTAVHVYVHNEAYHLKVLNRYSQRWDLPFLGDVMHGRTCTLRYAQQVRPGKPASLDALCDAAGVDRTARHIHGALLDARLLAQVIARMKWVARS